MKITKIQSNTYFRKKETAQTKPEQANILNLQSSNAMVNFKRDLERNSRIASKADAAQSNILTATFYKIYNAVKVFGKKD